MTLADVAREAGVSSQTVSRVMNRKGEVSPETRDRISSVIERLGYRPNRVAQALARQRTNVIGLIVPDITSPFYADVVRGVEDLAHQNDYRVFLCNIVESPAREQAAIASLEDHGVDGIILAGSRLDDATLTEIIRGNPNIVLFNRQLPTPHPYVVRNDDQMSAYLATQYLLEKGHRVICFMGGQHTSFSRSERVIGYRRALAEAAIPDGDELLFEGSPYLDSGRALIRQVLQKHPDVTAVLAYNDLMAIGALQTLKAMGKRIREEIALVGIDDILMARLVSPALTTIRQAKRRAGMTAMNMMLHRLREDNASDAKTEQTAPHEVIFKPELIVRESA